MEKKNNCMKAGFSIILCGVLTILLCAPAYGAALTVDPEDTLEVGTAKQMEEILSLVGIPRRRLSPVREILWL